MVDKGYSFAQVSISETAGLTTIEVKPGFMGTADVSGNKFLDSDGILQKLDWQTGDIFNYSKFYNQTSRLNRYRFVNVDSKLKPLRGHDGEIQVNANFEVEDRYPISFFVGLSNDGTEQSSGWRAKTGIEVWEALMSGDRLNLTYTLDPEDPSQLSSYFSSYQFGSSDFKQTVYAGYSDSKFENITNSTLGLDVAGDGFFTGYSASLPLSVVDGDSLALTFGVSYMHLSNQIYLGNNDLLASDEDLSLLLPSIGFQGNFANPFGFRGQSYWSIGVVSDLGTSKKEELTVQNPELDKGYWIPRMSFALVEPIDLLGLPSGIKLKFDGQSANEPMPTSLKKSLGGLSSIRGYREREAYGDNGFSFNFEFSVNAQKTSFLGLDGSIQNIFFYDAGYVSNEGSIAAVNSSVEMQSIGAGIVGNFEKSTDLSLQVGVPLVDSINTKAHDARTHFSINFRF